MPANNLVNEITSAKKFFASRAGLGHDKAGEVTLQKNFASALIQQMHCCLSLSPQDAATVHEALHDSPYGDDDTQRIIAAVDAKVLSSSPAGKPASCAKDQFLKEWWHMCTQPDWDFLNDQKNQLIQR